MKMSNNKNLLTQNEINDLLAINNLINEKKDSGSLVDEIKFALLNSGKLSLRDWKSLREQLREIEILIPHIDMIVQLKIESQEG
jgi:hypothetical protein